MPRPRLYKRDDAGRCLCPYCGQTMIPQSVARHISTQHPGMARPVTPSNPTHYARGLTAAEYQRAYRLGIHTSFHRDEQ